VTADMMHSRSAEVRYWCKSSVYLHKNSDYQKCKELRKGYTFMHDTGSEGKLEAGVEIYMSISPSLDTVAMAS
jgi:hypothetical protein